ncbi:MAG: AzlC family ABC transporter permease [Dorea sp.]|jgi:predicted branched-subunit amino acid permease|nr:AzlC family ABC transporter permease [Dorea sp.]
MNRNKNAFINGIKDGIPIALGYFAVAFSLGIVAKKAGLDPFQGFLSSFLNHASAGEYAEFTVIMANAPYVEMAFVILVTNIRYMLMSCALSQKFHADTSYIHRLFVGFGITDEIFGISIGRAGTLNPYYPYGAMAIALPSWSLGTAIGIIAGNILPPSIVSALSVALYGMFIAIIIPAAKINRIVGGVIIASFLTSFAVSKIPLFDHMSDSMKISLLTVIIAGLAAALFPVNDDESDPAGNPDKEVPEYDS